MSNLTTLKLQHIEVALPAMACIAAQLVDLDLEGSELHTGCSSAEEPTAFFSSCAQLARANFSHASLDAPLAATQLPSLRELSVEYFTRPDPDDYGYGCEDRANVGTGPFAHGCPSCERISLHVGCGEVYHVFEDGSESFSCSTLRSLQCLRMVVAGSLCKEDWPGRLDLPAVPSTVSRLEATSDWPAIWEVDLLAVLAAAAEYIDKGVLLTELVCTACTTLLQPDRMEEGAHPDDASGGQRGRLGWQPRARAQRAPDPEALKAGPGAPARADGAGPQQLPHL
jgi:hypothetical protein